jgi:PAS domain S-box-containing protein
MFAKLSLIQKGLCVIAVPLIVQLLSIGLITLMQQRYNEAGAWSLHTKEVLARSQLAWTLLLDVEASSRGYALTRDIAYTKPYQRAQPEIAGAMVQLAHLVQGDVQQRERIARLSADIQQRMRWHAGTIDLVNRGEEAELKRRLTSPDATRHIDSLREQFTQFIAEVERVDEIRSRRLYDSFTTIRWTLIGPTALAFLGTIALALLCHFGIRARLQVLADNVKRLMSGEPLAPVLTGNDEFTQVDQAFHDMAEALERAHRTLHESAEEVRDLYNNAPCGYHSLAPDGTFVAINDTELRWLGYNRREIVGHLKFSDLLCESSRNLFDVHFPQLKNNGMVSNIELELRRKNGESMPILLNSTVVRDEKGDFLTSRATLFDVTSLKRAEATIALYADIVRSIPIGLLIFRLDTPEAPTLTLVSANPVASDLLGIPFESMIGKKIMDVFPELPGREIDRFTAVANDGKLGFVDEMVYGDTRVRRNWWLTHAFPLPHGLMAIAFQNITDRKESIEEIRRLNEELEMRVLERTAELGDANRELLQKNQENEMFVYSVSHDLRSPLVNLEGFSKELGMICKDLRDTIDSDQVPTTVRERGLALLDRDTGEAVHFIQNAVKRLSTIIDALLRLSRAGRVEYQFQPIDATAMLTRIIESMRKSIDERGALVTLQPLPALWGDPGALEQVFANLLGNALKYLDPARHGQIEIGWRACDAGNEIFYVKDNGLGIPANAHEKVFQAFQRAHPTVAPGEGMGLAIVRRIVERHRGRVWVESTVGQGSVFYVMLPSNAWRETTS